MEGAPSCVLGVEVLCAWGTRADLVRRSEMSHIENLSFEYNVQIYTIIDFENKSAIHQELDARRLWGVPGSV